LNSFDKIDGSIVVTGATGWVGRTVMEHLLQTLPPQRLRAFASREGAFTLPDGQQVPLLPLGDLPSMATSEPIAALLHCAFLTPDRVADLGAHSFADTNRAISQLVGAALERSPGTRVVSVSSGAAALMEVGGASLSEATALYGQLKLEEESLLSSLAPTLVLRIYALSGRHMRDPRRYALGDFLQQALSGLPITIQSTRQVIRSYGHADAIAALALRWLADHRPPPSRPLATVSHTVDLLTLAETIAALYGQPSPKAPVEWEGVPDAYIASEDGFREALSAYQLKTCSLAEQIRDTAKAINPSE
jgi:nucleoside-diphosphate-sugar epimerase